MYRWWGISAVPFPCQSSCVKYPQPPQRLSRRRIFHLWRKLETSSKGCCWTTVGFPVGYYWCLHLIGVHSKYLRMRNEPNAACVLDVRCVVAFFRSKVAASWRKLVVFIVYDGRAVELILDCQQGSSITLHGLCSCILSWGGSEEQTGRPVTQKHAPAHIKTVRTKPIYRRFVLTGHL